MLLSDRILYVVEFNETEGRITRQVAVFANACRAVVVLLAAVAAPYRFWRLPRHSRETVRRNLSVEATRVAEEQRVEFIMVGVGAQAARNTHFIGATALELAHSARQHVWICKPGTELALEHVLCAVDASRGSAEGLRVAADICRQFNARLRTVSVLSPPRSRAMGSNRTNEGVILLMR